MLTIVLPVNEELLKGSEKPILVYDMAENPLDAESIIPMNGERYWEVVRLENYKCDGEEIAVALVTPSDEPIPQITECTHHVLRDGEKLSFCLHLSDSEGDISHEWLMHNEPPSQTITTYEQVGDSTLMKPVRDEWKVSSMKVFHPSEGDLPIFDAVYIAQVSKLELVAA